jgi:hypothetical protein
MSKVESAVPVLQVADVERSSNWYASVLGFVAESFPESPPYTFAILRRDGAEVMLQRNENPLSREAARRLEPVSSIVGWAAPRARRGRAQACGTRARARTHVLR